MKSLIRLAIALVVFGIALVMSTPQLLAQDGTGEQTAPAAVKITWKDGKTTITTDSAEMKISNRLQFRFTDEDPDAGGGRGSFRIRRARTKIEGWAYTKNLRYELQLDWSSSSSLLDFDVAYDFTGQKRLVVKAGQFKVPFGRQELTSSGSQEFVDRSIVSSEFARGRDVGVQLAGLALGKKVDWRAGVFNGAGRNATRNDNDKYQIDARVTVQPFGDAGYSESDISRVDHPLFALAVNYDRNDRRGATSNNDLATETVGTDVVLKYRGVFAYGELFDRQNTPETGAQFSSRGLVFQAGWFVIPQTLEIAGRWATIDPSDRVVSDDRTESGMALGWFVKGHNLKFQGDVRELKDDANGTTDREVRVQMQVVF